MIKRLFLLVTGLSVVLSTSFSASAQDDVFRSVGEDGTVEFSDRSTARSSEKFQISKPVVIPSPPRATRNIQSTRATPEKADPVKADITYQEFEILSPASNEGIWIFGDVQVELALTPELQAGHEVVVELDGTEVAAGTQLKYALPDVYRGSHTLQVSVRDTTSGSAVISDSVSFQVHRHGIKANALLLHPSLRTETETDTDTDTSTNPSEINEILSNTEE